MQQRARARGRTWAGPWPSSYSHTYSGFFFPPPARWFIDTRTRRRHFMVTALLNFGTIWEHRKRDPVNALNAVDAVSVPFLSFQTGGKKKKKAHRFRTHRHHLCLRFQVLKYTQSPSKKKTTFSIQASCFPLHIVSICTGWESKSNQKKAWFSLRDSYVTCSKSHFLTCNLILYWCFDQDLDLLKRRTKSRLKMSVGRGR